MRAYMVDVEHRSCRHINGLYTTMFTIIPDRNEKIITNAMPDIHKSMAFLEVTLKTDPT